MTLRDQLEETYTSSLFQTEPLYQFYDNDLNEVTQVMFVIFRGL